MNDILLYIFLVFYIVEFADNKITQKLPSEIKFINS